MATYPTDGEIDTAFPDNDAGDIGTDDMRLFQKAMTAAGRSASVTNHDATIAYLKDDLVALEGVIYFAINPNGPAVFDLADWKQVGGAFGSGVSMKYKWTVTTSGQVPTGFMGITGSIDDASNTVRISTIIEPGTDVAGFLSAMEAGDYLMFVEDGGGAESVIYTLTGPGALQSGAPDWHEIPVDLVDAIGEPEDGKKGVVSLINNPASKLPAGGTTGQVLTKLSDNDYDVGWA